MNISTLFILGMMKIHSFLGLVATASICFNKVSARSPIINAEFYAMKQGEIFNGKDSIKVSEYIQNLETVAGFKLNPNQIKGAKMDFENVDKNGDGLLDVQEVINQKLDKSDHLREPNKEASLVQELKWMWNSLFPRSWQLLKWSV